ncbi:MAG: anhydro-N-acetylmuramic acid kinase [Gammaproteobacteria bacterium]|nr:anhydro-N-acetylmuramic acid kinase [Gammaproteobacteria bacterium]MCF6230222.1 anhydro-N-acetylmuramic acid kinase [Gammaproteobacteria bacterium]
MRDKATRREIYIGLMSGTSLDAVDSVAIEFCNDQLSLLGTLSTEMPAQLRKKIIALCAPGNNELERSGALDYQLGELFSDTVLQLLHKQQLSPNQITAIGSHGQTIRHRPDAKPPFTIQIGSAAVIAQRTGITTVADFRSRDIAAGGEGAPLVPAFHALLFDSEQEQRCILNIGGIANLTFLSGKAGSVVSGFDCGPGNLLMNAWCERHIQQRYDIDGQWARTGRVVQPLLESLLQEEYIQRPPPKSTGRELFNIEWLDQHLKAFPSTSPQDVQATLCELTASCIAMAVNRHPTAISAVYVCGGGAHNKQLMRRLKQLLEAPFLHSSKKIGLDPDWVEACAFAWLARQTLNSATGNLPEVTGAEQPVILGAIHPV